MNIDELISKQKAALDSVEPVDQDVLLGDDIVTVRLWTLAGIAWRNLIATCPAREGAPFDQQLGYNLDAVVANYPRINLINGDDTTDVAEQWPSIAAVLTAADIKNFGFAVWGLNEFDPTDRLITATKETRNGTEA